MRPWLAFCIGQIIQVYEPLFHRAFLINTDAGESLRNRSLNNMICFVSVHGNVKRALRMRPGAPGATHRVVVLRAAIAAAQLQEVPDTVAHAL